MSDLEPGDQVDLSSLDVKFLQDLSEWLALRVRRILPDGREATVYLQMYNSRLVVAPRGGTLEAGSANSW